MDDVKIDLSQINNCRANWEIGYYSSIILDHTINFLEAQKIVEENKNNIKLYHKIWDALNVCTFCHCIIATFGAMFLEALINDYGATYLGNRYYKNYFDKLGLKQKWVVIPKFITGNNFPTDKESFELLTKLIEERNKLVHPKSKNMPKTNEELYKYLKEWKKIETLDVIKCLQECIKDLRSIDTKKWSVLNWIPIKNILNGVKFSEINKN